MYGLDAPTITRREFDGSDTQLELAHKLAAAKKSNQGSAATSNNTSAASSARASMEQAPAEKQQQKPMQKKNKVVSFFKTANLARAHVYMI